MVLIDTGPIVAIFDKTDNHHSICSELLKGIKQPFIATIPVLTEAFYLLSFSWLNQAALWKYIEAGNLQFYNLDKNQLKICKNLMEKYQDLPMDFADATLVAVAAAENISTIFTLDHKDFKVYKTKSGRSFRLLPPQL